MSALGTHDAWSVLFVGPREDSFEEVKGALSARRGSFQVHWVQNAETAPGRAADLRPDFILVDDDLGGADSIEVIRRLLLRVPQATILVMVTVETMSRASRAVMAGARGFVARPLKPDDLITTMELALAQASRPSAGAGVEQRGRVVVFCAPRGGTGRTTLAANTAVALTNLGERGVVLIDADYGAPAIDVALNLQARYHITDLLEQVPNLDREFVDQVLAEHASGVRALLAPAPNEEFEAPATADVQEVLAELKRLSGWVIVDLGLPLDELAFSFLDVADRIVVNVLPELVGLRNTRCMLDSMYARGYAKERIWLVASRSPSDGAIAKADVESRLHLPVVYQIPDDSPLVMHGLNRGVPVVTSHPRSALARAIRLFSQELIADAGRGTQTAADAGAERGWLGRLLGRARAKTEEPAADQSGREDMRQLLDMTESLLVEACPYLGLPGDPGSRFPYPCTANHCCASETPVQVDPAYQEETCFGGRWTPCPRFIEHLEQREAIDDGGEQSEAPGYEEIVINRSEEPEVDSEGDEEQEGDLSGSFVLQSCPYLGLVDDDGQRYPYPDPANCCHARDQVRPVTPAYQAKACFAGDWASCLQFKAGLSDSFFLDGPQSQALLESAAAEEPEPVPEAVLAPTPAQPEDRHTSASDRLPHTAPEDAAPEQEDEPEDLVSSTVSEGCPFLGLRDDPNLHHSSPDMDHYCHAGDWPKPVQPSFQVNYCLSAHWSLCENWEQATHQPAGHANGEDGGNGSGDGSDGGASRDENTYLQRARQRRGDVLNELDSLAALYLGDTEGTDEEEDAAPEAATKVDTAPEDRDPAAEEDASTADACPYLGLEKDPSRWVPYPHEDNYCQAQDPAVAVDAPYQIGTCFDGSWRQCPRCVLAQESPRPSSVVFPDELYVPPPSAAPEDAEPAPDAGQVEPAPLGSTPCPYLGLEDDEDICHPTAHAENHCHTRALPYAVTPNYQDRVCLAGDWQSCPRFLATLDGQAAAEQDDALAVGAPRRRRLPRWALIAAVAVVVALVAVAYAVFLRPGAVPAWLLQALVR